MEGLETHVLCAFYRRADVSLGGGLGTVRATVRPSAAAEHQGSLSLERTHRRQPLQGRSGSGKKGEPREF